LTKKILETVVHLETGMTKALSRRAVDAMTRKIVHVLCREGKFVLPSFGTFRVMEIKPKVGLNPRSGEKIKLGKRWTVRFRPSANIRKEVTPKRSRKR
jgi:DNA-binding protein HU-beta